MLIQALAHESMQEKKIKHAFKERIDGLVWLLFNVPVNNFSVMLGRSHCFLGLYQYFGELKLSCSRTLHEERIEKQICPSGQCLALQGL